MKILVIDDKDDARYFLKVLFEGKGHGVLSATNGKEALDILKEKAVDLIISDILMPDMDGFEFCKIVKNDKELKYKPFVFYTATYVDKKDEEFALGLGADLFLRKPMDPDTLMKELSGIMKEIEDKTYKHQEMKLKTNKDIYQLYNRRLIKKLEDKIVQLEQEIERRSQAEMKLRKALHEKEVLLKELYHRTRNNMQVIIAMLRLYSSKLFDASWNEETIEDIISKIRTMALVHHKLYESQDLSHVNLRDYFESMLQILNESHGEVLDTCEIKTELEEIQVLLDTAIPLGFIVNELITNACMHAFPDEKKGIIKISLSRNDMNQIVLSVQDNGIGLPEDFDMQSSDNVGLSIVSTMVEKQLRGVIEYKTGTGLQWNITLDKEIYSERV